MKLRKFRLLSECSSSSFTLYLVRALILFLTSTGVRIRAIVDLKLEDLIEKPAFDLYQVKVYSDSNQSYFTFTTPEAARAINTYLRYRERYGEKLTPKSPLFRD